MGSPEIPVRRAVQGDMRAIVGLSAVLFREDAGGRDPSVNLDWPREEGHGHFADLVAGEASVCLLAEVGGGVVVYLAARVREGTGPRPVRVAELESICVRENQRSRGVGTKLVEEFIGWAGSRGAARLSVTAYAANERAIRFCERFGFRPRSVSLERGV